ncbi:MAG: 6-bladed beta-propeller [Patescibacteria group bacterium]|nr:6-bladed beta-propeller [Patescibacteria group bacterium]
MTNKIFWKIGIGAVLIILIVWGVNSINKEQEKELGFSYERDLVWGSYGTDEGEFDLPYGSDIIEDENGSFILISDCTNNNIQKFTLDGVFVSRFGELGSEPGQLDHPADLTIGPEGNIWIVEEKNNRVSKFTQEGEFIDNFKILAESNSGKTINLLIEPLGITFDSSGNSYISNYGSNLVIKFDKNGELTHFLNKKYESVNGIIDVQYATTIGNKDAQFNQPYYIESDSEDNIYVVDRGNNRIQKFDPDGNFLLKWGRNGGDGTLGDQPGEFNYPHEIAIDKHDNIYVADTRNKRIQIFTSEGEFLYQFGGEGIFVSPKTVSVDSGLNVFVGDAGIIEFAEYEHEHATGTLTEHTHEDKTDRDITAISRWKRKYKLSLNFQRWIRERF